MDTRQKQRPAPSKKRPQAGNTENSRPRQERPKPAPETQRPQEAVYTQPSVFNRNRMLLQAASVVAIVLALILSISIFFKVKTVEIAGNGKYTTEQVTAAAGGLVGDNLLWLNEAKISNNIIKGLPYIESVRVGIKLPGTVKIEVVELDVTYSVEADDGSWWLIRSDSTVIEKTNSAEAEQHTKLLGVSITKPEVGQKAVAAQPAADDKPVTVKAQEKMDAAVLVMQYLEQYAVLGETTSINVADLTALEIWYGTRLQVQLGDNTDLQGKVGRMVAAVKKMSATDSGILDVTGEVAENGAVLTPFE